MRFGYILAIGLALSAMAPRSASAQWAAAQDSTLAGLQKVFVKFTDLGGGLGTTAAEALRSTAILELRKAGLRVARDTTELEANDAVLNISFIHAAPTAWTNYLSLRMDVEQMSQLQRTRQTTRMVTWYYEQSDWRVVVSERAPTMLAKGVNDFLSKWLDMNGR